MCFVFGRTLATTHRPVQAHAGTTRKRGSTAQAETEKREGGKSDQGLSQPIKLIGD